MATALIFGRSCSYDGDKWLYVSDGTIAAFSSISGFEYSSTVKPCPACGELPLGDCEDPCLGTLDGVKSACCGHGLEDGTIVFVDGRKEKTLKLPSTFLR